MAQFSEEICSSEYPSSPTNFKYSVFECFYCNSPEFPENLESKLHCTGCLLVAYCSKECLENDFHNHKPVCKEFPTVNDESVLYTTRPWEKHIASLRKRANRLPDAFLCSEPIFDNPRVCHTCHEARFDLLTICKCGCVCYCSEICAYDDKAHQKICKKLRNLKELSSVAWMRESYPESLFTIYDEIKKYGPDQCSQKDLVTLNIHIVTRTAYFDAISWKYTFGEFPNLEQLNLTFVIQGMSYNPSHDKSESLIIDDKSVFNSAEKCVITYSVHQKPYHMYFSSPEYTEPDLVVVYGIPNSSNDIHSEISYRNMTYCDHTLLVLMDLTEDLVNEGIKAVNAARPVKVLVPCELNLFRKFGSHQSELNFNASAPNEKSYITCLCKD